MRDCFSRVFKGIRENIDTFDVRKAADIPDYPIVLSPADPLSNLTRTWFKNIRIHPKREFYGMITQKLANLVQRVSIETHGMDPFEHGSQIL
jgi:hypothetical protein